MNKCEKCGFLHWRTDPCREPKKSTAEMNESPSTEPHRKSLSQGRVSSSIGGQAGRLASAPYAPAGTQAPPVDTNSPQGSEGLGFPGREVTMHRPAGKPFNKQAWQRAYMREYRKGMRRTKMGNNNTDIMQAIQSLVGVIQAADSSPGEVTVFVPGSIMDYIDVIRERGASDGQDEMLLRFASANKLQRY